MFRQYTPKDNVQKKSYYTDRFLVVPEIPKGEVTDEVSLSHIANIEKEIEVKQKYMQRDNVVIIVDKNDAKKALSILKDSGYLILTEMSAVDFVAQKGGFEIFYQLLNIKDVKRIRVKCFIKENEAIESVTELFRSADWSEREMYDMFGIFVNNHPNLKRILLPEDWKGHPLRKTYPIQGDEFAQWYEVDLIYGKEYRDIIGPEQRDAGFVNEDDTRNFARIGHEVAFGQKPKKEITPIQYQEEDKPNFIKELKKEKSTTISERR
jgi:NADH-quinone oxidoreductase subunit C